MVVPVRVFPDIIELSYAEAVARHPEDVKIILGILGKSRSKYRGTSPDQMVWSYTLTAKLSVTTGQLVPVTARLVGQAATWRSSSMRDVLIPEDALSVLNKPKTVIPTPDVPDTDRRVTITGGRTHEYLLIGGYRVKSALIRPEQILVLREENGPTIFLYAIVRDNLVSFEGGFVPAAKRSFLQTPNGDVFRHRQKVMTKFTDAELAALNGRVFRRESSLGVVKWGEVA